MSQGIFIESFLPVHEGHRFLIDFAQNFVEELTILVQHKPEDPIPLATRLEWVKELFPRSEVCSAECADGSPDALLSSLREAEVGTTDYVFCRASLGVPLAEALGAHWVVSDPSLSSLELESRSIREHPSSHWPRIPKVVRPYFLKKVCVFGPESTGKSTLCRRLAEHFQSVAVPEYARTYLEHKSTDYELKDVVPVARGQRAMEVAHSRLANRILFSDTDMLTTKIWSEWLFGECDPWVLEAIQTERHDLYLLTSADVPWVEDEIRYLPNDRENFEHKCEEELRNHGRQYVKIFGDWEHRFETAVKAVEKVLET